MFIDSSQFAFCAALERAFPAIQAECLALPNRQFDPWVQREMHGGGWRVFGLFALGAPIPEACELCPNTAQILATIPGLAMAGYSRLAPHTHIKPHVGWAKSVYRLHLGLDVPEGCRLRIGSQIKSWEEGRVLIFDDTVEHEAWNDSDLPRSVLLLDFLRPGLSANAEDHIPEEVRDYAAQMSRKPGIPC